MNTGTVKFFNTTKGFGFIEQDGEGAPDLFFHVSGINGDEPKDGDRVEYTEGEGPKGPHAENVTIIME